MPPTAPSRPSFSPGRKWTIGFNILLTLVGVIAVVGMVNYLSGNYFQRFYLSNLTRVELSPRTVDIVRAMTNRVQVTLYYDKDQPLYSELTELLKEYRLNNSRIAVSTVDYYRDPGAAQELRIKYNLGSATNKDFVLFDCEGRTRVIDGNALATYTLEPVTNSVEPEFRRKPVYFLGEEMFTAALITVLNPRPLLACFLQGHGEPSPDDTSVSGYSTFASILRQNSIQVAPLTLIGTNAIPSDCNLLVIAGPTDPIPQRELDAIDQYLDSGGRLLALFSYASRRPTGLEKLIEAWGVQVGTDTVKDPDNSVSGTDLMAGGFANHPVVNPLLGSRIELILPRELSRGRASTPGAKAARVDEIAFSGPRSYLQNGDSTQKLRPRSLVVAVQEDAAKGVIPERGTSRILAVGDSLCLDNEVIAVAANRDFAGYAVNWLLERDLLLQGIGPRPVTEFRLLMTRKQLQTAQWILLAVMPGGTLLLGGAVWLRRRR